MAKKKNYVNEYRRARENFMRRRREWIKKYHFLADVPTIPKSPTAADVKRLEKMKLKTMTNKQIKEMERRFDIAYEEGSPEVFTMPSNRYVSASTEDEYNEATNLLKPYREVFESSPVESEEEIMADLKSLINGLMEESIQSANPGLKDVALIRAEQFETIFWDAVTRVGNKKQYLKYLEDSTTHARLVDVVTRGIIDSDPHGKEFESAKVEFAMILNLNMPLTVEQSEDITMSGTMDFDFSDTPYE